MRQSQHDYSQTLMIGSSNSSSNVEPHSKEVSESPGQPERPIERASEDVLGRMSFVRRLADALIDKSTKKSRGIAIGVTGAWGSGKSSVLNLLCQHVKDNYPQALIVRFDPWLVSGRNDLISEFLRELIRTINADPQASDRLKKAGKTIAKYGEYIAPVVATELVPVV